MFRSLNWGGGNIITMCQFAGDMNYSKVGGLGSLINFMNEHFFNKDDPAVNEHHYHITQKTTMKRHIIFTMSVKTEHLILSAIDFLTEPCFNKNKCKNSIGNIIANKYYQ